MQEQNQSDGQLLAAFVARRDEQAFAVIVERHGRMLLRVAGGILGDDQEAQDVVQAAFLTLARKAPQLRTVDNLGPWLHRVAHDVAVDAVRRRERRRRREQEEARMNEPMAANGSAESLTREQQQLLQDELGRLPDRYRAPLVLCYLEGVGAEEAAQALGLAGATLRKRLERARELLRKKLVRRGVTVGSVGALTALLSAESGAAVLPATIVSATVKAAGLAAAGKLAVGVSAGTVSAHVAALSKGALNMLFWNSVKTAALTAACAGIVGTSVVVAQRAVSDSSPAPAAKTKVLDVNPTMGTLVEVAADGTVMLDVTQYGNPGGGQTARVTVPAADGYADAVRTSAAKYKAGEKVKVFWYGDAGKRRALAVAGPTDPTPAALRALEKTGFGAAPRTATGDSFTVFKPIDATQPGFHANGKWIYALEIKGDQRQGFLKYDAKNVGDPQPGDHILTPWGWMQWQEKGNWLPVAEKPAKGKQLPDPAAKP